MENVWWKIYRWPEDVVIGCNCTFNMFGSADSVSVWPEYGGGEYDLIGFGFYWKSK